MNRMLFLTCFLAILWSSSSLAGPKEEVAARLTSWSDAFAAGDAKAISDIYAPDARLWGTLAKAQDIGIEAITKYFENVFLALPTRKIVIGDHAVRPYDGAVVASGSMELSFTRKDGTSGGLSVRFSMAFIKNGDTWKVVDHHSSPLSK